jgi:hypothetical protein
MFFPTVTVEDHETFPYPLPTDGKRFWSLYAEPISEFLYAAFLLAETLGVEPIPDRRAASEAQTPRQPNVGRLSKIYSGMSRRTARSRDGSYHAEYEARSLLAYYAGMAARDLEDFQSFKICADETCRTPFVSRIPHRHFCCSQCGERVKKADARERAQSSSQTKGESRKCSRSQSSTKSRSRA